MVVVETKRNPSLKGEREDGALVRLTGVIKWFSEPKKYGFIVPDDGQPDILLHKSHLCSNGSYQSVFEGDRIVVEVIERPKGLQVSRVLSIDKAAPVPSSKTAAVTSTSDFTKVRVKWFDHEREFGFLTRGGGTPDIFVHREILHQSGIKTLQSRQIVEVRYGQGPKGLMATEIRLAP